MNQGEWFAVYTSPRWERKVTQSLTKKRITAYCPTNTVLHEWSDKRKGNTVPLFMSYVFVQSSENDQQALLKTKGVIGMVHWKGQPAQIRNEEIEAMKSFLNDYPNVRLEKTKVNLDATTEIIKEPQIIRKGKVIEVKNSSAKVSLPSLGHVIIAEVRKETTETESYVQEMNLSI